MAKKAVKQVKTRVKAKRIGDMQTVDNTKKWPSAADKYNHIRVQVESGEELHMLFTDREIRRAVKRASRNPEDLPKVSWLRDIFD